MELRKAFAKNLKKLRLAAGLSQEQLALRAGLDRTYISDLERSVYNASVDTIERIAKVLKVEPKALLTREGSTVRKRG